MMIKIFLTVILLLNPLPIFVLTQPTTKKMVYTLALQWPCSLCNVKGKTKTCIPEHPPQQVFTIHGLWPNNKRKPPVKVPYNGPKHDPTSKTRVPITTFGNTNGRCMGFIPD
ncbi:hypothetical protein CASFOL_029055 [Castilleja foliolosa]|uniref:Uncharacterized protein n=1 Tax=Castilleja foliolosa TaxID=1961234 RepID=A0ABD3CG81_9LAMI